MHKFIGKTITQSGQSENVGFFFCDMTSLVPLRFSAKVRFDVLLFVPVFSYNNELVILTKILNEVNKSQHFCQIQKLQMLTKVIKFIMKMYQTLIQHFVFHKIKI